MLKMQARDRVDAAAYSAVSVKVVENSYSKPLPSPPAPAALPQQYYSGSSFLTSASETAGLKIQTVTSGTQTNKNSGKMRIGNIRSQAIPAPMVPAAAALLSRPIDFQSVDGGGATQNNDNTGEVEIANLD